jgi:hypothetical protein
MERRKFDNVCGASNNARGLSWAADDSCKTRAGQLNRVFTIKSLS